MKGPKGASMAEGLAGVRGSWGGASCEKSIDTPEGSTPPSCAWGGGASDPRNITFRDSAGGVGSKDLLEIVSIQTRDTIGAQQQGPGHARGRNRNSVRRVLEGQWPGRGPKQWGLTGTMRGWFRLNSAWEGGDVRSGVLPMKK